MTYTEEQKATYPYRIIKGAHKGHRARLKNGRQGTHRMLAVTGWVLQADGTEIETRLHRACLRRVHFPNAISEVQS